MIKHRLLVYLEICIYICNNGLGLGGMLIWPFFAFIYVMRVTFVVFTPLSSF